MKAHRSFGNHRVVPVFFAILVMLPPALVPADPKKGGEETAHLSIQAYVIQSEAGMVLEDQVVPLGKGKADGIGLEAVLSKAEGRALLETVKKRAEDGKGKLEVLAAPSVVTRSGQRAKVEMIREFIYPTEYDPPELPGGMDIEKFQKMTESGGVFPVTPANPTAFETRHVGLMFEYDPKVLPGARIALLMALEDVQFDGFINYGTPIKTTVKNKRGQDIEVVLTENRILMPVFSTRKMTSSVELENGGWVLLGGLPEREEEAMVNEIEKGSKEEFKKRAEGPIFFLIHVGLVERPGD